MINKILLARYRALINIKAEYEEIDVKIIEFIDDLYYRAILSTPKSAVTIMDTQINSPEINSKLINTDPNLVKHSENIQVESTASLMIAELLKKSKTFMETDSKGELDTISPTIGVTNESVETDYRSQIISQELLGKSRGIVTSFGSSTVSLALNVEKPEVCIVESDSKASLISTNGKIRKSKSEIISDSKAELIGFIKSNIKQTKGYVLDDTSSIAKIKKAESTFTNGLNMVAFEVDKKSTINSTPVYDFKITNDDLSINSSMELGLVTTNDVLALETDGITTFSKTTISSKDSHQLDLESDNIKSFFRATLSKILAWENPVLNNNNLYITQAFETIFDNNILEVV